MAPITLRRPVDGSGTEFVDTIHAVWAPLNVPTPDITEPSEEIPVASFKSQPVRFTPCVGRYVFRLTLPSVEVHITARGPAPAVLVPTIREPSNVTASATE
jgi:hypothetical protein